MLRNEAFDGRHSAGPQPAIVRDFNILACRIEQQRNKVVRVRHDAASQLGALERLRIEQAGIAHQKLKRFVLMGNFVGHLIVEIGRERRHGGGRETHAQHLALRQPVIEPRFGAGHQVSIAGLKSQIAAALRGVDGSFSVHDENEVVIVGGNHLARAAIDRRTDRSRTDAQTRQNSQGSIRLIGGIAKRIDGHSQKLARQHFAPIIHARMRRHAIGREMQQAKINRRTVHT